MAVTYGYFNSLNGDRKYNAETMTYYFKGLITDGVFERLGGTQQNLGMFVRNGNSGMSVKVGSGRAVIDCHWINNSDDYTLTLPTGGTADRIDSIAVKLDMNNRLMQITSVQGTPAQIPIAPSLIYSDTVKYLKLADVYIAAGTTSIRDSMITDRRTFVQLTPAGQGINEMPNSHIDELFT